MAIMLDGFSTTIAFAADSSLLFEVKELTPPPIEGGGGIDVTTMSNTAWRTMSPKSLKTLGQMSLVVAYDPESYDEQASLVNTNNLVTITFPDTTTLAFYAYVESFTPGPNTEGEQPTATIVITPTLRHSSTGAETAPVYT